MSIRETITRRGFLAAGVVAGAVGLASGSSRVVAISSSRIEVIERWVKSGVIGKLVYFQFHLTEGFDLETAVMMVEALTRDLRLEKVSALGDWEFSGAPGNVLASLYFEGGIQATISSIASKGEYFGTVLGEDGSIRIGKGRIDLLRRDGSLAESVEASPALLTGSSVAYPMILRALREGVTVFA